jgi:hypothetical protein
MRFGVALTMDTNTATCVEKKSDKINNEHNLDWRVVVACTFIQ